MADARARIGHFIDWYNFQRTHSGIDGLVPSDRYFGAAPDMLRALKEQAATNALDLARNGLPKPPFYVAGQVGGRPFSLHAEGERVFLVGEGGTRHEVDLVPPAGPASAGVMPVAICPNGSPAGVAPADAADSHDEHDARAGSIDWRRDRSRRESPGHGSSSAY
jgi:hypothetical protein